MSPIDYQRDNEGMYHYNPETALEELNEDASLPHPVHVRDMIVRSQLRPDQALELNRKFQTYLQSFGDAQSVARSILQELTKTRL
jgi:hypothetical protein